MRKYGTQLNINVEEATTKKLPELLTVREVATQLRVDDTTVRRWIKQGILNSVSLPRRSDGSRSSYRVPAMALEKLMEGLA